MARRRKDNTILLEAIMYLAGFAIAIILGVFKLIWIGVSTLVKETASALGEYKQEQEYLYNNAIEEQEQERLEREEREAYDKAINRLRTLISYTENKLYYQVVKTEFPSEGRIREYVNFMTYDRATVAIENANELVNDVLNNVLCIYNGKSKKLSNTIVLDDYACDMKDISKNLADKLGVEEVHMLMS